MDTTLKMTERIRLKEMKKVDVPIYNFVKHARETKTVSMYGANVIIFEGLFAFHNEEIRDMLDMKVCCCFVDFVLLFIYLDV